MRAGKDHVLVLCSRVHAVNLWKPAAFLADAVEKPATKLDSVGTSPALPVRHVITVHQRRDDLDLLMGAAGPVEVVLLQACAGDQAPCARSGASCTRFRQLDRLNL